MAAQAYDRAAYYLYGTRANLNFRLKDVLADATEVPASIKQAKEQAICGQPARPLNTLTSSCSSSSSTCSYSPHHSVQSFSSVHTNVTAGRAFLPGQGPAGVYLQHPQQQHPQQVLQQQQQCLVHVAPQQQLLMQQSVVNTANCHSCGAWPSMALQQQQQQLAVGAPSRPPAVLPQPGLHSQQQQQHLVASSAGLLMSDPNRPSQAAPGASMPDVVASVIAALDLPPQSASPAASACSASFGPWAGNSSSAGLQVAVSAFPMHCPPGLVGVHSSSALTSTTPGMVVTHDAAAAAAAAASAGCRSRLHAPWLASGTAAVQLAPAASMSSSYAACQPPNSLPANFGGPAAGAVVSLTYLEQQQQAHMLQLQQQEHMLQQQQAHMLQLRQQEQMQAQGMASGSAQHMLTSISGGVAISQQEGVPVMYGMPAGMPLMVHGGVVLTSAHMGAAVPHVCPQPHAVLTSAMM